MLAGVLTAVTKGGLARRISVGALALIVVLVLGFISLRDTAFVKNSDLWNRIAHISTADGQTRFTLWHMAYEGFLERPVLGWGQEGFNYVFNKYYDPTLYQQEPWFDRAHNAFVDWLTAGGLPAFLLYISLFATAIFMLWRSPLPTAERVALTCVILGYAFHNVFVFDKLVFVRIFLRDTCTH
jgi:O-antigen ligase